MRDEYDSRMWVENGPAFSRAVDSFLNALMAAARTRVAIQFDAPWRRDGTEKRLNRG